MSCYPCTHCNKCGAFSLRAVVACADCGAELCAGVSVCPTCGSAKHKTVMLPPEPLDRKQEASKKG